MSDDIKYIDIAEFRETGFLQEANRQFFHPLGLALSVQTMAAEEFEAWLDETTEKFLAAIEVGDLVMKEDVRREIKRLMLDIGGAPGERLGPVWDYRDDPEGMMFDGPDNYGLDPRKAANVDAEARRHTVARLALFGSNVQPIPKP